MVELIVVMAIIAILSAVSVSSYFLITEQANQSAVKQTADNVKTVVLASISGEEYTYTYTNGENKEEEEYKFTIASGNNIAITGKFATSSSTEPAALSVVKGAIAQMWTDNGGSSTFFDTSKGGHDLAITGQFTSTKAVVTQIGVETNSRWAYFTLSDNGTYKEEGLSDS